MNDIQGDKLKQFQKRRDEVLNFIRQEAKPLLQEITKQLHAKEDTYKLPEKELEQSRFTLALVGAFQSGKSTFFNYLCDGRELSPVGPGGGGIRTSGCRVAAHSLHDGEKEHAEVTWRSAAQLVDSFGAVLRDCYDGQVITTELINLEDKNSRAELEKKAWEALGSPDISGDDKELLRFAMVVAHFYPEYQQHCREMRSACSLTKAVKISSYPQDWDDLWLKVREANGRMNGIITKDMVAFAFCGGVDMYLDSGNLSALGCSIVDCPGLFASKWDTRIATECIEKSNAILYMFRGDKSMTQQDLEALHNCIDLGGRDKLIFGANLHTDRKNWRRIVEKSIKPKLTEPGLDFDKPVVHEFHSALALRSRELFLLEIGQLCPTSRAAIEYDMELAERPKPYDDEAVKKFIHKRLKSFAKKLVGEDDADDLKDDFFAPVNLENESGAQEFLQAANNMVVKKRAVSILVNEGAAKVRRSLETACKKMQNQIELLSQGVEEARRDLEQQQNDIDDFEESRKLACDAVETKLAAVKRALINHYKGAFSKNFMDHEAAFVSSISKHLPGVWDQLVDVWVSIKSCSASDKDKALEERIARVFGHAKGTKKYRAMQYQKALGDQCLKVMRKTIDELKKDFAALKDVKDLRDTYEGQRKKLMKEVNGLKALPSMDDVAPIFPPDFMANINDVVLPSVGDLMERVELTLWQTLICAFRGKEDRIREKFKEDIQPQIIGPLWKLLEASLDKKAGANSEAGPIRALSDICKKFKEAFSAPAKAFAEEKARLEVILNNAENEAQKVDELRKLSDKASELAEDCKILEQSIRDDFAN